MALVIAGNEVEARRDLLAWKEMVELECGLFFQAIEDRDEGIGGNITKGIQYPDIACFNKINNSYDKHMSTN